MKRKLDENDVPASVAGAAAEEHDDDGQSQTTAGQQKKSKQGNPATEPEMSFADLGLDSRLLQAVSSQGYRDPTLVQRKAIPLALEGQDVLCKAKTGSGKTAAYVLPVLSGILKRKSVCWGFFLHSIGLLRLVCVPNTSES
jgi:ATP-dependent RNA helicase DDX56/DBP9